MFPQSIRNWSGVFGRPGFSGRATFPDQVINYTGINSEGHLALVAGVGQEFFFPRIGDKADLDDDGGNLLGAEDKGVNA
jgi:hypothetical protein